jgi:hypothetical protein
LAGERRRGPLVAVGHLDGHDVGVHPGVEVLRVPGVGHREGALRVGARGQHRKYKEQ